MSCKSKPVGNTWIAGWILMGAVACTVVSAQVMAGEIPLRIPGVQKVIALDSELGHSTVVDNTLVITAKKGTDLFVSADGSASSNSSPRALFDVEGDFIFSAKVEGDIDDPFDGSALIVYANSGNWAKLLFEKFLMGKPGVASTVSRSATGGDTKANGDDVYHGTRAVNSQYLKIARLGDMFILYSSADGESWNMLRSFSLATDAPVRLGFAAQSPIGEEFTGKFSDIEFKAVSLTDFWQGK